MLADDDFRVWTTWRIPAMSPRFGHRGTARARRDAERIEGAQDALEQAARCRPGRARAGAPAPRRRAPSRRPRSRLPTLGPQPQARRRPSCRRSSAGSRQGTRGKQRHGPRPIIAKPPRPPRDDAGSRDRMSPFRRARGRLEPVAKGAVRHGSAPSPDPVGREALPSNSRRCPAPFSHCRDAGRDCRRDRPGRRHRRRRCRGRCGWGDAGPAPVEACRGSNRTQRHRPGRADSGRASADAETEADHESFGYIVSHDLRAPIRVVDGLHPHRQGGLRPPSSTTSAHDHLDRILGAAARMNSMIDALLALSRLSSQPLEREPVDLSQLARYVRRRPAPAAARARGRGRDRARAASPRATRRSCASLLENLLGNAWKYSTRRQAGAHRACSASDGEATTFTVRDNGAGFDMRFADRLFGVFQRLHSAERVPGHRHRSGFGAPHRPPPRRRRSGPSPSPTAARAFTSRCRSIRRGPESLASRRRSSAAPGRRAARPRPAAAFGRGARAALVGRGLAPQPLGRFAPRQRIAVHQDADGHRGRRVERLASYARERAL